MKKIFVFALAGILPFISITAQHRLRYTAWTAVTGNVQFAKSSLYFLGTGAYMEISKQKKQSANEFFLQGGYTYFFKKTNGAFTAHTLMANAGYRYRSKRTFYFSGGLGVQYWLETMRLNFPGKQIKEDFMHVIPMATLAAGFCFQKKYSFGLEYHQLYRFETNFFLTNHVALSIGYTF